MRTMDQIIGYEQEKQELAQLCDMMRNPEVYERLGAKPSKGLLLHGKPGLGKTMMAVALIEESGRKSYVLRRNKPGSDFIQEIYRVFREAVENAPSILLLDDMDKFVVEENSKEEYVVLQSMIDEVAKQDVYIVATVNNLEPIPDSLLRAGRFDRKMKLHCPTQAQSQGIIAHYLSDKCLLPSVCLEDISGMLAGQSCAKLDTILNEAAIYAGNARSEAIGTEHIVEAFLRVAQGPEENMPPAGEADLRRYAYHEAGHAVVQELLHPESVGFVSIFSRSRDQVDGMAVICGDYRPVPGNVPLALLAGAAAVELALGVWDNGAGQDLAQAKNAIGNTVFGTLSGMEYLPTEFLRKNMSPTRMAQFEGQVELALEKSLCRSRELLAQNRPFLDALAGELLEKRYLFASDVRRIRQSCDRR